MPSTPPPHLDSVKARGIAPKYSTLSSAVAEPSHPENDVECLQPNRRRSRPSSTLVKSAMETGCSTNLASTIPAMTVGMPRPMSLLERRNRERNGLSMSCLSVLSMDTINESGRNAEVAADSTSEPVMRGWSSTVPNCTGSAATRCNFTAVPEPSNTSATPSLPDTATAVKVIGYNLLAARLVTTDRYPTCPSAALAEDYRVGIMKSEFSMIAPDIATFAEMSVHLYESPDSLGAYLRDMKYAGEHQVITDQQGLPRCRPSPPHFLNYPVLPEDARRLSSSRDRLHSKTNSWSKRSPPQGVPDASLPRRTEMEGVAIFYNTRRFRLVERIPVLFNRIVTEDTKLSSNERKKLQSTSHNVALICVLEERQDPRRIFIVAAVHFIWQRLEAQLYQAYHLMLQLQAAKAKHSLGRNLTYSSNVIPTALPRETPTTKYPTSPVPSPSMSPCHSVTCIVCGDFNMERDSPAFQFLQKGYVPSGSAVVGHWRSDKVVVVDATRLSDSVSLATPHPFGNLHPHIMRDVPSPRKSPSPPMAISRDPVTNCGPRSGQSSVGDTPEFNASYMSDLSACMEDNRMDLPKSTFLRGGSVVGCEETSLELSRNASSAHLPRKDTVCPHSQPKHPVNEGLVNPVHDLLALMEDLSGSSVTEEERGRRRTSLPHITHDLRFTDCYSLYCRRHPSRVSAVNPSTNNEGKVLDHVLVEEGSESCVAVLNLGEKRGLPNMQVPSDHYPVGVILAPATGLQKIQPLESSPCLPTSAPRRSKRKTST